MHYQWNTDTRQTDALSDVVPAAQLCNLPVNDSRPATVKAWVAKTLCCGRVSWWRVAVAHYNRVFVFIQWLTGMADVFYTNKSSAVTKMGDRGHKTHRAKRGGLLSPFQRGEELRPHLTQFVRGRGLPARQVSSWSNQPFGHNTPTLQTERQTGQDRQTDNGPIA